MTNAAATTQVRLTLPDASVREYPAGVTGREIAESIGPGLAKAAVAIRVDGTVRDLMFPIRGDAAIAILTERDREALDVLRHSAAHIMATAVREIFPTAGIGFGPSIDEGFYYDFEVPRPFTPEDLEQIEARMAEVTKADYPFTREEVDRAAANRKFADDPLKLERISELGDDEVISTYTDGPVHRPVPRPACAQHRPAQALQAAQYRRRLLAGRLAPADAAAHLRHRVLQEGRARGPPPPAGGGAEARPPSAGQGTRPLHVPSVRAGRHLLDRPGHDALQPAERVHARAAAWRVPGDQDSAPLQQGTVGDLRALGQVQGEHVPRARQRDGGARQLAQADELPVALPDVQCEQAFVS